MFSRPQTAPDHLVGDRSGLWARLAARFDQSEAAREARQQRLFREAMAEARPDLDPEFALSRLSAHHRWSIRALVTAAAVAMMWSGIAIYRATPPDAAVADYMAGPAVGLFGVVMLSVCMFAYDLLAGLQADRPWRIIVAEVGALALVTTAVVSAGLAGGIPAPEMVMNVSMLMVAAAAAASSWTLSTNFHAATEALRSNGARA
jgi:hypothetical protein